MKKRILFLLSDTGGGHRAAAQAIEEAIHYLYPSTYETYIEDIWKDHTLWPVNKLPDTYAWLTSHGMPLWKLMWSGSARLQAHKLLFRSVSPVLKCKIISYLNRVQPDIIVSVHPFMNHLGLNWIHKARLDIPFVTVVTDMVTIHPMWICPAVTYCIVPTHLARQMAIRLGMPPRKVEVCGQPVALKFMMVSDDKITLRRRLGWDLKRRTIMIMGGGEGIGPVFDIARLLAKTVTEAQLIIVAGRNKALKTKLNAVTWEIPTKVYGFVHNMPELMRAADLLITKAGPNTIGEAFIAGLPPLISGYIPGQEWGNVTYVQEHQAGAYASEPQEIVRLVKNWIDPNSNVLQEMARNAAKLAKPKASLAIAGRVCELI